METTKSKRVARSVLGTPTGDAQHFTVRPTRKEKEEEEEDDDDDEKEEEESRRGEQPTTSLHQTITIESTRHRFHKDAPRRRLHQRRRRRHRNQRRRL